MSYLSKDEQLLVKIKKYLSKLRHLYSEIEPLSDAEIEDGIVGLALSQCVTNLFELSSRIGDDDVASRLAVLSSGRTAGFRNIAAHDYDSISWSIAKKNCRLILESVTEEYVDSCLADVQKNKSNMKDYTDVCGMNIFGTPKSKRHKLD